MGQPTHFINLNPDNRPTGNSLEAMKKNSQSASSISKLKLPSGNRALYSTMPPAMPSENSEQYVP